ncbi:hypothetical protein [Komagataeibacter xylinus]|nr:hypothetical protein [Komagataeibacter xylinus]
MIPRPLRAIARQAPWPDQPAQGMLMTDRSPLPDIDADFSHFV